MCLETTTRFVAAAADTQVVVVCVGGGVNNGLHLLTGGSDVCVVVGRVLLKLRVWPSSRLGSHTAAEQRQPTAIVKGKSRRRFVSIRS